jgi:8-amino-7-oxononanoate synthase
VPPLPPLDDDLTELARRDRLRALTRLDGSSRAHPFQGDRRIRAFCSNDYLGLAEHPDLIAAADAAARSHGFGAGASRLLSGHLGPHDELEQALADLVRLPAALLYSTGYQANLGVVTSLAGPEDLIASDQANHASLIDGCRLSRATVRIYPHLDPAAARDALRTPGHFRRRFLITESLFSMDGDRAPLRDLAALTADHEATLIVDEAHALGVLGPTGRGLCQEAGIVPDVLIGTLGKAFGAFGGFVAGADLLRRHLINRSRTFIYTTALPPPVAAAARAGVALALSHEGDRRRALLVHRMRSLRSALARLPLPHPLPDHDGPILPLVVGPDQAAVALAQSLANRGFFVPAVRPPTVPDGTARLRVTLSAAHTDGDVDAFAAALADALGPVLR